MNLSIANYCLPHERVKNMVWINFVFLWEVITQLYENKKQKFAPHMEVTALMLVTIFPKGSILQHLFFNIFINNIFLFIEKSDLWIFADDNILFSCRDNLSLILKTVGHDIKIDFRWFSKKLYSSLQSSVAYLYPLKTSKSF